MWVTLLSSQFSQDYKSPTTFSIFWNIYFWRNKGHSLTLSRNYLEFSEKWGISWLFYAEAFEAFASWLSSLLSSASIKFLHLSSFIRRQTDTSTQHTSAGATLHLHNYLLSSSQEPIKKMFFNFLGRKCCSDQFYCQTTPVHCIALTSFNPYSFTMTRTYLPYICLCIVTYVQLSRLYSFISFCGKNNREVAFKHSVGYAYSILFSYWRKVFSLLLLGAWHVSVAAAIPGMVTFTLMTAGKMAQHKML